MEFEEEVDSEEKEYFQQQFKMRSQVLDLLNEFGKLINAKINPIEFSEEDREVLFEYAKIRIQYLKGYCRNHDMENSLKYLAFFAFEALFLLSDDFNLDDDLDKKIDMFKVIMDNIRGVQNNNLAIYLKELMDFKKYDKLLELFGGILENNFYMFMALLLLKYQPKLFNEFMIRKISTYSDITIDFEYDEIQKLSPEKLIDDLCDIFSKDTKDKKTKYVHLKLEKGKLKCSKFTNEEILEILDDLDEETEKEITNVTDNMPNINESDISFSEKNNNNDGQNKLEVLFENKENPPEKVQIKEEIDQENKNQQNNEINYNNMPEEDLVTIIKNMKKDLADLKKFKEENATFKEKQKKENEEFKKENEEFKKENEEFKKENEEFKKENEEFKKENEEFKKENEEFKKQVKEYIEKNERIISQIKKQEKTIQKQSKTIESIKSSIDDLELDMSNNKTRLAIIESDLSLIKFRKVPEHL